MYVLSWRTVSSDILMFIYKHQNNPLVSAETVRQSSTCIILYFHDTYMATVIEIRLHDNLAPVYPILSLQWTLIACGNMRQGISSHAIDLVFPEDSGLCSKGLSMKYCFKIKGGADDMTYLYLKIPNK